MSELVLTRTQVILSNKSLPLEDLEQESTLGYDDDGDPCFQVGRPFGIASARQVRGIWDTSLLKVNVMPNTQGP
jgi:hypothetical protein